MMKWIRRKILGHESTIGELALNMLNIFQRTRDRDGDVSTETLYFDTVVAFLEKWYVGPADVETAAHMIMSSATDVADSLGLEVNLRVVSSATLIAYYASTPKFKLKGRLSQQMIRLSYLTISPKIFEHIRIDTTKVHVHR